MGAMAILAFGLAVAPAAAVEPDEVLADPRLEARARALSSELRCMVCQNQSIDDSNAPLARDLRILLRERIAAGETDTQVLDYLVDRYGEFVLLRPRFGPATFMLWLGPLLILILACAAVLLAVARGRRNRRTELPLSAEEASAIETLMSKRERSGS
jgi:cytochrome c-type biogenesis protein CcmH